MYARMVSGLGVVFCAAIASAQPGTENILSEFEVRIVPFAGSNLVEGGTTSLSTVRFWLQARSRRPNSVPNFGVMRAVSGYPTGNDQTSILEASRIAITGDAWIGRAPSNQQGTRRGRSVGFAYSSASNLLCNDEVGNNMSNPGAIEYMHSNGFWRPQSIQSFDSVRTGPSTAGMPAGYDPWTPITDGSWSVWFDLYAFSVNSTAPGQISITSSMYLRSAIGYNPSPGGYASEENSTRVALGFDYSFTFDQTVTPVPIPLIPSPAGASLLGIGCITAVRRRRR